MFTVILMRIGAFADSFSISLAEMVLGTMILMALYKTYKTKDYTVYKKGFFIFYMMMILAEIISTFAGIDPERSVKSFTSFWVMSYLPVVFVLFEGKDRMGYLMWVFAGSIMASVYGIGEFYVKHMERADGFFSHSLTYGNVLAMVCITAVGVIVYKCWETRRHLQITLVTLVLGSAALILSASRGPILAFIIVTFVMCVIRYRWRGLLVGLIAASILAGVICEVPKVEGRFADTIKNIHNPQTSIGTRIVLWEATSKAIMVRPWFGYGKRNFQSVINNYIAVPTLSRAHAHNSYLQYTFLHGFFGLFALMGFLISLFYEMSKRARSKPFVRIAVYVLIVYLLEGLTENNFTDSEVVMMCYSLIGVMLSPGVITKTLKKDDSTEFELS